MKKLLSLFTSLIMGASILAVLPATASATVENTTIDAAKAISLNTTYTIDYGTDISYGQNYYVKVTLPSSGYITALVNRPIYNQSYNDMAIIVYNSKGVEITRQDTNAEAATSLTFRVGLSKGTYYINFQSRFFGNGNAESVSTSYRVGFTANNYCEVEPNDGIATATSMTYDKTYTGFIEPDGSSYDYYKFTLSSAKKVRIYIGNYSNISAKTYFCLFKSTDSYETSITNYRGSSDYNSSVYKYNVANTTIITSPANGTGYINKYLTAGTYYISVSAYTLYENAAYSLRVANAPASTTTKSSKPAQVTKLKLKKGGKKTAKLAWKKVKGAKGYQIKYSTSKKFKKSKTKTKTSKKNKITLKKLTKNRYYIKVRAYKKVNGKKVYGKYSSVLKLYRTYY